MIKKIQLTAVLRNKRFILFTILVPMAWFVMMQSVNSKHSTSKLNWLVIDFIISVLMGILGNSLVTFGKRISDAQDFYLIQSKISGYSIWRFMLDSLFTQIILNGLIMILLVIEGFAFGAIKLNLNLLIIILGMTIFGIYISVIGFALGMVCNKKLLDTAGFPMMIIIALIIIPMYEFSSGTWINLITVVQKIFPGFYLIRIINHLTNNLSLGLDPLWLSISFVITLCPFVYLIWKKLG